MIYLNIQGLKTIKFTKIIDVFYHMQSKMMICLLIKKIYINRRIFWIWKSFLCNSIKYKKILQEDIRKKDLDTEEKIWIFLRIFFIIFGFRINAKQIFTQKFYILPPFYKFYTWTKCWLIYRASYLIIFYIINIFIDYFFSFSFWIINIISNI